MEAVTVVARFRGAESGMEDFGDWILSENTIKHKEKHHEFNFDSVLNPSRTQEELYEAAGRKIISFFMDGYNATIFAYGQSGSGKTFSMLGPEEVTEVLVNQSEEVPADVAALFGILPRATFHIFEIVKEGLKKGTKFNVKVSYIEVYNEMINDILASPPNLNLKMREFPNQGMCVIGMLEAVSNTPELVFEAIANGTANRVVCSTGQNSRSSRSHTVFIISLEQTLVDGTVKTSKINLVDLAGSEKLSKTGAEGQALKEAQKINLSLTTLGRCIKALTSGGAEHVPYRESKLTLILKESLSGAAMTTLIVTGSMRKVHQEETIGTMQFAERAKMVKTSAKSNAKRSYEELEKLFAKLSEEVKALKKGIVGGASDEILDMPNSEEDLKKIKELEENYARLSEKSMREIEELRKKLETAEKDMGKIDYFEVHEGMEELRDKLSEGNEKLGKISKEKEEERDALSKKIDVFNAESQEILMKLTKAQQEAQSTHKQLELLQGELKEKDQEVFALNQKIQENIEKSKEFEIELHKSEDLLNTEVLTKSQITEEIGKIKKSIEELHENKSALEKKIHSKEAETQETLEKFQILQGKDLKSHREIEVFKKEKQDLLGAYQEIQELKQRKYAENEAIFAGFSVEVNELIEANNEIKGEIMRFNDELNAASSIEVREATNQRKEKYADEISGPVIAEINMIKAEHADLLKTLPQIGEDFEKSKEIIGKSAWENTKLKEESHEKTVKNNQIAKEIDDERTSKVRISKNLKSIEDSLATAIKEAEQRVKADMQFNIVEFVQKVNILNNELEHKVNNYNNFKNSREKELKTIKDEILKNTKEAESFEINSNSWKIKISEQEKTADLEKNVLNRSISEQNSEILKLKEQISSNESKLNQATTEVTKLEADVRQKAAERDIEKKNTMRKTIVPRKMSVMSPIVKIDFEPKKIHSVVLKKTNNKFLNDAIKESENVAAKAPVQDLYKVHYDFQVIKALYANIDDYASERKEGDTIDEEEEEYKASDSDSD